MAVPTLEELVAMREELSSLAAQRRTFGEATDPATQVSRDIINKRWAMLDLEYSMKLREFIEAGQHEMVRP